MSTLTPEGQQLVQNLAQRHGFSIEAVTQMLTAVIAGHARTAQFYHPEFGGNGQWMSGGMLMLGDMFNRSLKGRVDALCTDISNAVTSSGRQVGPAQSQSQGNAGNAALPDTPFFSSASASPSESSSSTGDDSNAWWPSDLGSPSSVGTQDSMRYAYFANAHRLAIDDKGDVRIYDTLDHQISGFSQQQGGTDRLALSSQNGTIELSTLPEVSQSEVAQSGASQSGADGPVTDEVRLSADDPVRLIERLGELHERGILTDDEFAAKKAELLSRL